MLSKCVRLSAGAAGAALSKELTCSYKSIQHNHLFNYRCSRFLSVSSASTPSSSGGDASAISKSSSSSNVSSSVDSKEVDTSPAAVPVKRIKHKTPKKQASSMLAILQKEEFENLTKGRPYIDVIKEIEAGDTVEIEKLPYMTADPKTESIKIRGLVIAKVNKLSDTRLKLINSELNTPIERDIPIFNPTILNVTILQKRWLKGGVKRIKRKKLYYMTGRDPKEYTIK